jgi:GTP-binding protein Era
MLIKKHGFIAIVGTPNAGKSTLTNAMLGQKLSIVSPKIQTTRNSIKAILTEEETQLILIDTPGIFIPRQDKILERVIVKAAWQGLRDNDYICFVVDAEIGINEQNKNLISDLKKENLPICFVINKIDLVKKSHLLEIIAAVSELGFSDIFPISALQNDGVEKLKKFLFDKCQKNDWIYDSDQITDASLKFIATEITREKLFLKLHKEIPYNITVKNDSYEVLNNLSIKIHQTIFVSKESQKAIIIGKRGEMLKQVGIEAKRDFEEIANAKVHLFLFVKVKENWMNEINNYELIDLEKLPKNK